MEEKAQENQQQQENLHTTPPKTARIPKYLALVVILSVLILGLLAGSYLFLNLSKSTSSQNQGAANTASGQTQTQATSLNSSPSAQINVLNPKALPLGDGKVSSSPKVGYVYSCIQNFKQGGAQHIGNWIHGTTWDSTQKISVEGKVSWPSAQFLVLAEGSERVITGNGLPVNATTGIFPIQPFDPAYQIDRNPNSITAQNISLMLPLNPTIAQNPSCVPMGMIGVAVNGVAIYNALDASGRDAVAHEAQDSCDGHPESTGEYHYHGPSSCIPQETQNNKLIGYALDGFGIYSMYDASGKEITNADLDACHGTTSVIPWNGKMVKMYHYVLTREYPYTVGCFMGTPVRVNRPNAQNNSDLQNSGQLPPSGQRPPLQHP